MAAFGHPTERSQRPIADLRGHAWRCRHEKHGILIALRNKKIRFGAIVQDQFAVATYFPFETKEWNM
ncbi:MAG: hypothetical protein P1V21_21510 [Rhizobiaceae bacterium]|nr:hypothetical protein [Rhizobiaceae bacterium]